MVRQPDSSRRIGPVVNPSCDPLSGQPESKHTPVHVKPFAAAWYGFALSRRSLDPAGATWWARLRGNGFWRYEMAGDRPPVDWDTWARGVLGAPDRQGEWICYRDAAAGRYRFAIVRDGRLTGCLFVAREPALPSRTWLATLFGRSALAAGARAALLTGQPPRLDDDQGAIVCACHNVGRNRIVRAIQNGKLQTVAAVGAATSAGTNCGSCKPELATLITEYGVSAQPVRVSAL